MNLILPLQLIGSGADRAVHDATGRYVSPLELVNYLNNQQAVEKSGLSVVLRFEVRPKAAWQKMEASEVEQALNTNCRELADAVGEALASPMGGGPPDVDWRGCSVGNADL